MKINVYIPPDIDEKTKNCLKEIQVQMNLAISELKKEIENLRSELNAVKRS